MKKVAWIDLYGRKYEMGAISDEYLINITKFISRGGGHSNFLTREIVINLFDELKRRGFPQHYERLEDALRYIDL